MVVNLSPELQDLVREKLETGLYSNEDDVVAHALRLLDERDRQAALEAALDEGEADLREGRFVTVRTQEELDSLFRDL